MEAFKLKKTIVCEYGNPATAIIEGTSKELADIAYRYEEDFSDANLEEIRQFADAMHDEASANKMTWMLESRDEIAQGLLNLGQMKIDVSEGCNSSDQIKINDSDTLEIWRERDKVIIFVSGFDEEGSWSACNSYPVEEFLNLKTGSLDGIVGETISYGLVRDE